MCLASQLLTKYYTKQISEINAQIFAFPFLFISSFSTKSVIKLNQYIGTIDISNKLNLHSLDEKPTVFDFFKR